MGGIQVLKATALVSAFLACSTVTRADTLFKNKTPLAIGHATKLGKKLHWTDCDGKNPKDFDAPPYWADAAANCSLAADSFGLTISDQPQHTSGWAFDTWTKATVQDATFSKKLFPAAKMGDTILVSRGEDSIRFKYAGKVQELKTETAK